LRGRFNGYKNGPNDGIPDNHNDSDPSLRDILSNNSVTLGNNNYHSALNFGLENENITLTAKLSLPSGGINPSLSGSIIGNFTNGTGSNSGVIYHEVGIIELNATISDNDYLNIGESETLKMLSKSGYVGRFIPASFDVAVTKPRSFDNTCTTTGITPFTYIDQDFGYLIAPTFSVTAKNASNVTTQNYRGDFVKLGISSITVDPVTADTTNVGSDTETLLLVSHTVISAMTAVANNNGIVNYSLGADRFKYGPDPVSLDISKESNSEVYPFTADIDPVISFVDDGEVSNAVSQVVNIEGNDQRFGRVNMANTHRSELNDLQMPMTIEYLNASAFVINTDDNNCTQIDTVDLDITLTSLTSTSTVSITNTPAEAGRHVDIAAPGDVNNDVVRVSPNLDTSVDKWLRYDWNNDGNFNNDPSSTATFGINKGNPVQIFMRQIYQ
jgi:MSHA biogenesis protein MshQ